MLNECMPPPSVNLSTRISVNKNSAVINQTFFFFLKKGI